MRCAPVKVQNPDAEVKPVLAELFTGFLCISLFAFGGVLPFALQELVERRRWLTLEEFRDLLALCQFLPGGNVMNLAVVVGARFRGLPGAIAAFLGLISLPLVLTLTAAAMYSRFGQIAWLHGAFSGVSAAAAGLVITMTVKLAIPLLKEHPTRAWPFIGLVFLAVGLGGMPLPAVLAVLAPLSILTVRLWPS